MKKLKEESSTEALTNAARVHIVRLKSNPLTEALAPPAEALLGELKSADAVHAEKQILRMVLTGQLNYCDSVLDDLIMDTSRRLLVLTGGDREDLRYRAAFSSSPTEGTASVAGAEQDKFVRNVVDALRSDSNLASLSTLADPIEAALADVANTRVKRDEAYTAEGIAFNALRLARVRLIDAIHSNHPRLQLIFPKKKRLVESFFP